MTATADSGAEIVPFGKYRNRPVTDLLADRPYVDWLMTQAWFANKQPAIYNVIVGAGGPEPQDTPEHNAMQARYLDEDLCACLGGRYLASEDQLRGRYDALHGTQRRVTTSTPRFEVGGWDVKFTAFADMLLPGASSTQPRSVAEHHDFARLSIELKPSIGDDYPTILREVAQRREVDTRGGGWPCKSVWVVIADRLEPSSVTPAQVRAVFASRDVDLLLSQDIARG